MADWPTDVLQRQARIWIGNARRCRTDHPGCACSTIFHRLALAAETELLLRDKL